jgi:hypothetical protein
VTRILTRPGTAIAMRPVREIHGRWLRAVTSALPRNRIVLHGTVIPLGPTCPAPKPFAGMLTHHLNNRPNL